MLSFRFIKNKFDDKLFISPNMRNYATKGQLNLNNKKKG